MNARLINIRLVIALVVYAASHWLLGVALIAATTRDIDSIYVPIAVQAALQLICVPLSCFVYYRLLPREERGAALSKTTLRRLALAAVVFVATTYVTMRYGASLIVRIHQDIQNMLVVFTLHELVGSVLSFWAPPIAFLATLWLTSKNRKSEAFRASLNAFLLAITVAAIGYDIYYAFAWANDYSGWTSLAAIPMDILSAALFLVEGPLVLLASLRMPKGNRWRVVWVSVGAILTVLGLGLIIWLWALLTKHL